MTSRGLLGLPQGQRTGSSGTLFIPAQAKYQHSPDVGAINQDYLAIDPYPNVNGSYQQLTAGLPYPIIAYGFTAGNGAAGALFTSTSSVAVRLGTGAAGSEICRAVWNATILSSVQFTTQNDPFGVYIPANTRIALAYYWNPSSGQPSLLQLNYGRANREYPMNLMEVVGTGNSITGSGWNELGATPPVATGCWIVGHVMQSTSLGLQAIRYGFGAAGSETAVTAFYQPSPGNGTSSGNGTVMWFRPFWWPPGTRLAIQGNSGSRGFAGYTYWRDTLL